MVKNSRMCVPVWNSGQQHKEAARIRVTQEFEGWGALFCFWWGLGCLLWSFLVSVRYNVCSLASCDRDPACHRCKDRG